MRKITKIGNIEIWRNPGPYGFTNNYRRAVELCEEIGPGWRLPSMRELEYLYRQFRLNSIGRFFVEKITNGFWSNQSQEEDDDENGKAFVYYFGPHIDDKGQIVRITYIRKAEERFYHKVFGIIPVRDI